MTLSDLAPTPVRLLSSEGHLLGPLPEISRDGLLFAYEKMLLTRLFSQKMIALQRQGRSTTFGSLAGQEATIVGLALPLQAQDWLATSYRELTALHIKGVPLATLIASFRGFTVPFPPEAHCLPYQIVIGTQMLHAVGLAMAARIAGDPAVAVGVCGDGATSEGDVHDALNFAGVYNAPVVLVVQNNGWAISVPRSKQTAAEHLVRRAAGYGIAGVQVDGNDILAVYQVMREAVESARSGGGPTLIESLTYRLGAHTTADDPTRYRDPQELAYWEKQDPLLRFQLFLEQQGLLSVAERNTLTERLEQELQIAVEEAEALQAPEPSAFFEHISADLPPRLQQQRREFLDEQQGGRV